MLSALIAFAGATTTLVAAAPIQGVRRSAGNRGEVVLNNEEIKFVAKSLTMAGKRLSTRLPSPGAPYRRKRPETKKPTKAKKKKPKSKKKRPKPKKKDPEESGDDDPDSGDVDESGEDDDTDESGRNDIDDDTNSGDTNTGDTDDPDDETDCGDDDGKHGSRSPKAKGRKEMESWNERNGWDNAWTGSHEIFESAESLKRRNVVFGDDAGNDGDDEGDSDK